MYIYIDVEPNKAKQSVKEKVKLMRRERDKRRGFHFLVLLQLVIHTYRIALNFIFKG